MLDDIILGLKRLGLEEKEARVYVALLSHPGFRVQELAEAAGLARATSYDLLDELVERGFAVTGEGEHGKRYFPQSPENLLSLLRIEQAKWTEKINEAEAFVPMLTVLYNPSGPRPRVRYKEGVRGLKELQREYEQLSDDILQLVGYDAFLALHDPEVTGEHRGHLMDGARKIRAIVVTAEPKRVPVAPNIESRIIPPELLSIKGEMTVCGDRVAFFSYDVDMIALEIHSPAIAGTCRAALELAWKQAETITKNLS